MEARNHDGGGLNWVGDASFQTGYSEAVIRKHYLALKSVSLSVVAEWRSRKEADQFWKIVPQGETLPDLEKKDGRYVVVK